EAERLVRDTRAAGAERVCVGLGVSTGAQAAEVGAYADGVIVGSAFGRALVDAPDTTAGLTAPADVVGATAAGARDARRHPCSPASRPRSPAPRRRSGTWARSRCGRTPWRSSPASSWPPG